MDHATPPSSDIPRSEGHVANTASLSEQTQALLKALSSLASEAMQLARVTLTDTANQVRAKATDAEKMAREQFGQTLGECTRYTQQNPLRAVAYVALFGLVLGWLTGRSSPR